MQALPPGRGCSTRFRSSRETELAAEYPLHVVTAWLGNTPKIAMKHYLMVTDSDYELRCGKRCSRSRQGLAQRRISRGARE